MRTISVSTLLALGLAVHQTAATAWTDAQTYSNPSNTNNQCLGEQSKGLGFEDHPTGDLGNYGALNWGNLRCTDGLQKRTFGPHGEDSHDKAPIGFAGGRCASGVASKDVDTSPKFSCGPEQKGMSIDHIHVSTSEKTEIELHYGYGNGVVCKQTATCSPAGNIIKNNQCGDAKTVTVKLPNTDTKDKCEIGIHSVGFNCGPASSKLPTPSSTPAEPKPVESTPLLSTSQETKPYPYPTPNTTTLIGSTAPPATIPSSISIPSTSTATLPIPSTTLESPTTPIYSNTSVSSTSPVETIPTVTPVSSTGPIDTFPTTTSASSTSPLETVLTTTAPGTTVPLVTTEVIVTTLTTCPVTNTITSGSSTSVEITSTISTVFITSTSTVCTYCVAPPASIVETTNVPIDTSIVPEIPETTPIPSATGNSPETSSLSIPSPSSSVPAPVPTTTQAIITTDVVFTTLTTCPVTNTITSGDTTSVQTINTVSTITSTSTSTICTQCAPPSDTFAPPPATTSPISPPAVATPASSTTGNSPVGESSAPVIQPSSPAQASPSQAPPAQYPSVLPNCMKTWITITTCKDTTDSSCYCLDAAFTKTVQECISAWAANNNDVQGALSNLAGICADHVSNNPGIITNVPKTITLVPTPASPAPSGPSSAPIILPASSASITSAPSNAGGPPAVGTSVPSTVANSPVGGTIPPPAANPVTTLSLSQPVPYACPVSQLPDGQPQAPASSCTSLLVTQVIVPQVGFGTVPAAPGVTNPSVDLVPGLPAPNPAVATAGPVAGNSPATTFGTVVGSVSAIGSTFPQAPITPFTGSASNIKITGFGILAVVVGILFLI